MTQKRIHMKDLHQQLPTLKENELILDVRTPEEFEEGHVPGAHNIPHEQVDEHCNDLKSFEKVYVYCRSGKRCQTAGESLSKAGLNNFTLITESGMADWMESGLPTEKGKTSRFKRKA